MAAGTSTTPSDPESRDSEDPRVRWAADPRWAAFGISHARFGGIVGLVGRVFLAVFFLIPTIGILMVVFRPEADELAWEALVFAGVFLTFTTISIWDLVRQIRAMRLAGRVRVAGRDRGLRSTCPRCAGDPFADLPCCRRFPQGWTWRELHDFWHAVAMIRTRKAKTINVEYRRPRGPDRTSAAHPSADWWGRMMNWTRLGGSMFWPIMVGAILGLGSTLVATAAAFGGLPIGGRWIWWIGPTAMLVGFAAAIRVFLLHRKEAKEGPRLADPRCRSCGYELRPPWSGRCPECGSGLDAWNTVSFARNWRGDGSHVPFHTSDEG